MDWIEAVCFDWAELVDGLSNDIDDAAECSLAHRDLDWKPCVLDNLATCEAVGAVHRNGPDHVFTQVLRNLQNKSVFESTDFESIQNGRQSSLELHVNHGT